MSEALLKENNLDDDVDVESYIKNSVDPEAAFKELGFALAGVNTAHPADPCKVWRKHIKSGVWAVGVTHDNDPTKVSYFLKHIEGRGIAQNTTELERNVDVSVNDVRRKVLKWKHEDAQEVIARLLDSTADNPDAFEPHAVLELMTPHRCPTCRSHNVRGDIGEGLTDCYTCGASFSADRIQEDLDADDPEAFIRNLPVIVPRITTSFSQTTPESAAQGDHSDNGWIDEDGVEMVPDAFDYEEGLSAVDLAVKFLLDKGASEASSSQFYSGVWYSAPWQTIDYRTGTDEERSFHLHEFSEAEERAIWDKLQREWKRR